MSETSLPGAACAPVGRTRHPKGKAAVSFFEFWPGWLFYIPVVAFWVHEGDSLPQYHAAHAG